MKQRIKSLINRRNLLSGLIVGLLVVASLVIIDVKRPKLGEPEATKSPKPAALEPLPEAPQPFTYPKGDRVILPNYRIVALYGTPDSKSLGSLGEQPLESAIQRIKELAAQYQSFSSEPIYPAFEIITTVASAGPTFNNDFSNEIDIAKLRPWVDAAKAQNLYVLLDLQPGLSDFPSQAKMYEELLKEPHVGLALDPEWRLKPGQRHMKQIGSVGAAEINQTAAWLADLVKANDLPQKMLLVHQFKLSMITDRASLDTSRPELAWLIQMDGLGSQPVKQDTWRTIRDDAPASIYFGWKNFIDEDKPMLTPEQTMQVEPKPWYISYQ